MIRVGGPPSLPPEALPPEALPPEETAPEAMPPEAPQLAPTGGVDPDVAGYKDPDEGPFACGNCAHFDGTNTCEILSEPVEPEGLCNLFTRAESNQDDGGDNGDDNNHDDGSDDNAPDEGLPI